MRARFVRIKEAACFACLGLVLAACNGSSDAVVVQAALDQFFDPGGAARFQIITRGGTGTNGDGGFAGYFEIYAYSAGNISVLQNGTINTAVSIPAASPSLGSNPRTIAADTTITPLADGTILGDDGTTPATGLRVVAGVTLTLRPNRDYGSDGTLEQVNLLFRDGVVIDGTVLVALRDAMAANDGLGPDTADLFVEANNLVTGAASRIDASGDDGVAGAHGGDIDLECDGTIITRGTLISSGGDGLRGGNGGTVYLYSYSYGVYNSGPITTDGGTGSADLGGSAGDIQLYATESTEGGYIGGPVVNQGTLNARGGAGLTGGGSGGDVDVYSNDLGAVLNSADINTSGGNATGAGMPVEAMLAGPLVIDSNGGNGGDIYFYNSSGSMRVTGTLRTQGGNAVAGNGGSGGDIDFENQDEDYIEEEYSNGGVFIGADANSSGGNGFNGGSGGHFYVNPDQDEVRRPGDQPTYLAGYSLIDGSGGTGTANGGSADSEESYIYNDGAYDENDTEYLFDILLQVPIRLNGGNGSTGSGGLGGYFAIYQDDEVYNPNYTRVVRNTATIELKGGSGLSGGRGGEFYMFDHYHCSNEGAIDTSGGAATSSSAGNGGGIEILSDDTCNNAANLTTNGGSSVGGYGGSAGNVNIAGNSTTYSGVISARGGNAGGSETSGGSGGFVNILSTQQATPASGSANVQGGSGDADGSDGEVRLDGIRAALTNGAMTFPG